MLLILAMSEVASICLKMDWEKATRLKLSFAMQYVCTKL